MFKIIKQILTLDKDNPSKYEMLFLNEGESNSNLLGSVWKK